MDWQRNDAILPPTCPRYTCLWLTISFVSCCVVPELPLFSKPHASSSTDASLFTIKHFAGAVTYSEFWPVPNAGSLRILMLYSVVLRASDGMATLLSLPITQLLEASWRRMWTLCMLCWVLSSHRQPRRSCQLSSHRLRGRLIVAVARAPPHCPLRSANSWRTWNTPSTARHRISCAALNPMA